jgi:hypothetical protein
MLRLKTRKIFTTENDGRYSLRNSGVSLDTAIPQVQDCP